MAINQLGLTNSFYIGFIISKKFNKHSKEVIILLFYNLNFLYFRVSEIKG